MEGDEKMENIVRDEGNKLTRSKKKLCFIIGSIIGAAFLFIVTALPIGELEPQEVIELYYEYAMNGEYDKAYDLLSLESRSQITKEQYIKIQKLDNEIDTLVSFNIKEKVDEHYYVGTQTLERNYKNGETEVIEFLAEVVEEEGGFKYNRKSDRLANDWRNRLIEDHYLLHYMYKDGVGKEKDEKKSKEHLEQVKRLLINDNDQLFFSGTSTSVLGELERSNEFFNEFVEVSNDKRLIIAAYHNLISNNILLGDFDKTKNHAKNLLEVDPGNPDALYLLSEINQAIISE